MSNIKSKRTTWILVGLWMIFIFCFSAQPADTSSKVSLTTGKILGKILITDFEKQKPEQQTVFAEKIEYGIRKTAHLTEYAILAVLLMFATGAKIYTTFVVAGAYAISDEVHQLFVQGRSCQSTDVFIDSIGIIVGISVVLVLKKILSIFKIREKTTKN